MRDLSKVIEAMLAKIPSEQTALSERLTAMQHTIGYVAPEMSAGCWREVGMILESEMGAPPQPGWQTEVANIFMDLPSANVVVERIGP